MATKKEILSQVQALLDDDLPNFGSIRNRLKAILAAGDVKPEPKPEPNIPMAAAVLNTPTTAPPAERLMGSDAWMGGDD